VVSAAYESYILKSQLDGTFPFKTRTGISTAMNAYKIRWENQQCVSDAKLQELIDTVLGLQQGCALTQPAGISYADWQSQKKFYKGIYASNYKFMCSQWNKIRVR
jgi:hypothetical protein